MQQLDGQDLSSIPSVLARILAVSRNPKSNAADLAAVCEMDKASSARLLRAANSVYYATESRYRIDSIKDAIVRIGFSTAEEIIISSKVSSVLKSDAAIDDYSSSSLWKHSVAVGIGMGCFSAFRMMSLSSMDSSSGGRTIRFSGSSFRVIVTATGPA